MVPWEPWRTPGPPGGTRGTAGLPQGTPGFAGGPSGTPRNPKGWRRSKLDETLPSGSQPEIFWPDGMLIGAWRRSKLDEKIASEFYPAIFLPDGLLIGAWRKSKLDEKYPQGLILRLFGLVGCSLVPGDKSLTILWFVVHGRS